MASAAACGSKRCSLLREGPASSTGARAAAVCDGVPVRHWPDDLLRRPLATTSPPPGPASGPRSMTQSAVLITSRLCSTTMTVLPRSARRLSTSSSLRMSSKCKPGGRLVEDVERLAGAGPGQFGGQLDALGLAAGERRRRLAERQITEADVGQRLQDTRGSWGCWRTAPAPRRRAWSARRRSTCPCSGRPGSRGCSAAVAGVALDPDVGQEVHLDLLLAVALAGLATAARLVEAEPARLIAADLGLGSLANSSRIRSKTPV